MTDLEYEDFRERTALTPMTGKRVTAPWSAAVVLILNARQQLSFLHEYTCTNGCRYTSPLGKVLRVVLVATPSGWLCPACLYEQDWAHENDVIFTADMLMKAKKSSENSSPPPSLP